MGGQTQESLTRTLLTPEGLVDFIEELRRAGFNIGMAEYIAAQDLLLMLTARGEKLDSPQRIASLFGPLLCSSPAEQESFPEFFLRWSQRYRAAAGAQDITHEETMAEALENTAKRGLRWEWRLFTFGVVILILTAWLVARNFVESEVTEPKFLPTPSESASDTLPLFQLASIAVGLLGVSYIAWRIWWGHTANQFLQRRQSKEPPDIKRISLVASDEALFPSLTFLSLARMFRQRKQVISQDLNVVMTVERSVEHGGWLDPVYDHLMIPPEYLVLVDRRSRFDHLAEFVDGMVKRLESHGVFVTAYVFDGDPRLCFPIRSKGAPQSLVELAGRYDAMRLVVFTEAQGLLSPVNGRLAPWTRLFNRWPHRSVLTPESPSNWGVAEYELQREFTVLPGTTDGLAAFMRIIQGQEKIEEVNSWADSALPPVLQERPQRWLERDAPSASQIDSLLDELKAYLGEDGYTWLKACAVYPELQWQITITLGQLLNDVNGKSLLEPRRLIDLARLPWFRYGTMPDWLRTRLVLELTPDQEEEVRSVLDALLVTAVQGHGESLDLEIAHERRDWTSRLARPLLRLLRREAPSDSPVQDNVFLDFMLQRMNLAVRIPGALRRQLFTRVGDRAGWEFLLQWVGVNLISGVLVTLVDFLLWRFSYSEDTQLSILFYGIAGSLFGFLQWLVIRRVWRLNVGLWIVVCALTFGASAWLGVSSGAPHHSLSMFGFSNLFFLGLLQAGLLASRRVPFSGVWWLGSTSIGFINTFWLFFVQIKEESFTFVWLLVDLASVLLYCLISGWLLLSLTRLNRPGLLWMIRPIWILANSGGIIIGVLLVILLVYLFQSLPLLDEANIVSVLIVLSPIVLSFVLGQTLVLRHFKYAYSRLWFFLTTVAMLGTAGMLFVVVDQFGQEMANMEGWLIVTVIGIVLGIFPGIAQAIVWRRGGLPPFQSLIWLLTSTIGWSLSLAFGFWFFNNIQSIIDTLLSDLIVLDQLWVVLYLFLLLPLGLITSLPLQRFLKDSLRLQAIKGTQK